MAAVIGARGGVGASTIATSLAWLLGEKARPLDRAARPRRPFRHRRAGARSRAGPRPDRRDRESEPHRRPVHRTRDGHAPTSKLAVLSAEAPINPPLMTDGSAFYQLQEEMRTAFECTVVDLPRDMLVQHPHLINDVHVAVVVTELTLAAARDTIRILSWLKSNAPQTKVIVVANRVPAGERWRSAARISRARSSARSTSSCRSTRSSRRRPPSSASRWPKSAKTRKTVAAAQRARRPTGRSARRRGRAKAPAPAPAGGSLLGKLGNLKSLLSKPKARRRKPIERGRAARPARM